MSGIHIIIIQKGSMGNVEETTDHEVTGNRLKGGYMRARDTNLSTYL